MKRKFTLFLYIAATSALGFLGGMILTKSVVPPSRIVASSNILQPIPRVILEEVTSSSQLASQLPIAPSQPPVSISDQKKEAPSKKTAPNPCLVPKKEYPDYTYLDVGQEIAIPEKYYIPDDLTLLDKSISTSKICLKKDAGLAVTTMINAAKKDGYHIKVSSGFRSYSTQDSILTSNIKSGNKNATKLVAKPGYSEHQLGVAVDMTSSSIGYESATTKFEDTPEADWLEDHASEYGFIESYPEDMEDITGYLHEAWHYRYVGIENAKEIIKKNQTTNQYLKEQKEEEAENNKISN
jgi:D-alanyl-D-alanine carboxypeptidase